MFGLYVKAKPTRLRKSKLKVKLGWYVASTYVIRQIVDILGDPGRKGRGRGKDRRVRRGGRKGTFGLYVKAKPTRLRKLKVDQLRSNLAGTWLVRISYVK